MKPNPVLSLRAAVTLAALVTGLAGCTSGYTVRVDAISQATQVAVDNPGKSYRIVAANPMLDNDSLHYKEVAAYVRTALSAKGMYEAADPAKADVVVAIDYGMNQPRVKFQEIAQPVVEDSGGRMVSETVNSTDPYTGLNSGPYTATRYEPPTVNVVGMETKIAPIIVYEKYLNVSARSNQTEPEGRAPPEVWSVNVSAEDESKELRKYLPLLAAATSDYIGKNTHEEKDLELKESSDSVTFIKKGM
jgi:hypothetical protein